MGVGLRWSLGYGVLRRAMVDYANFNQVQFLFPDWVLVYTLVSIPFGQVLSRALRYFSFSKRLKELKAAKVGG